MSHLADSEKWIIRNGIGIQIMETLAVGAFLTALAVQLGASNLTIGLLAAIPHLSQLAQIPAVYAVDRMRDRKRVYNWSGWVARPMLLVIALAAWFLSADQALAVIIVAFAIRYAAGAFLQCAWSSWMRDLVPDAEMGRLFGIRQQRMLGIGIALSLIGAAFVDVWKKQLPDSVTVAYGIVYFLSFLGGAYAVICARKIHEPPMQPARHGGLFGRLREPFQHENYQRLIRFLASWTFAINLAAPFFTVHMLKRMELDLLWVIGLGTLSQLAAFLTVTAWGRIADRFSNKAVLRVCGTAFVVAIFAWTFTTFPDVWAGTFPLLIVIHIVAGIATAGVNLASGNIALKLAPAGNATAYLASSSMVNALAGGVAALCGGAFADLFATWELSLTVNWHDADSRMAMEALSFTHWDFFFFLATVIGIYALHRLSLVGEEGDVRNRVVLGMLMRSARQSLRNLSTIAGLRAASSFDLEELSNRDKPDEEDEPPAH
ncbi:MAG: MFS transporter [Pseudomonadales bacterium]|nr:MFS transporter [Pseudomonadales bacterium]MCP5185864.1 MFS transporter [Pseudomonadales bacterium]